MQRMAWLRSGAHDRAAPVHTRTPRCPLAQVAGMARQMVINFGMSDIGPWSLMDPSAQQGDMLMRMMARNSMSENLQERIDNNVRAISMQAYEVRGRARVGGRAGGARLWCWARRG